MPSLFRELKLQQLDAALARWRAAELPIRPSTGWLRTIREALGMPGTFLAKRLGVVPSTITRLESSEADDTISLGTLRRAAEALGCELRYVLLPRDTLAATLEARADELAKELVGSGAHSMALEDQSVSDGITEAQVHTLAETLLAGPRRELWRTRAAPKYQLAELIAECDPSAPMPADLVEWDRMPDVGKEIVG